MLNQPDPVAFTVFNIDVMWYGVLISLAMVLGIFISCRRAGRHGLSEDDVLDTCIWMLPFGIIGARLYYVLFNLQHYHSLGAVLNIRNGGLAIHGGLIAAVITVCLVCRHKKIGTLNMLDLLIPSVALAQAIGRWGNFFNGEAHGGPTDLPWGIIVDGVKVHPTFLYESIWCLALFVFLSIWDRKHRSFNGQNITMYGMLYSFERFWVEGLRTDSLMIGPFRQAQVLSITVIAACAIIYAYCRKRYPLKKGSAKKS